nr:uncharacterized protein taf1c isoform X2 [Scatophagus argus]
MDFTEHMQNFFMDYCHDAFGCMGEILGENFRFREGVKNRHRRDSASMWKVENFLDLLNFKICHQTYFSKTADAYSALLSDVVHAIPPELLGSLLYEELTEQRRRLLFSEQATGGALAFVPFSQSGSSSQSGCLIYPGNEGLDCLNFHRVELQHHRGSSSCVDASSSDPFSFQLKGPIRQISSASLFNNCCVAVRSDHLCGVWRLSDRNEPRLLQVINAKEAVTCINTSPHVLGEVLVASESGAAKLWTVGRGIQTVRTEDHNLYFNAKSSWRWCEFSAHPRVMLYADRTGVELTDIRVNPALSHTLFRISSTSECRSGERLILSRYLGDVHAFHHLITTQHSAYIVDERFPSVPMLKWDHMMQSPPMFCHVLPGSASPGSGEVRTTKILLGAQSSQEITLLQYSGGRAEACFSRGPPQSMLRPRDSLKHLPVQIPHRLDTANNRLSSPATGLTCIQKNGGGEAGGEDCICVLQLTESGDIFYQILEHEQRDACQPPAAEDDHLPRQAAKNLAQPNQKEAATSGRFQTESQLVVSDTSSDEDIIEPTQWPTAQRLVAETPEKEQRAQSKYSESSSEDSESGGKGRVLKRLRLQVVVNDFEMGEASGLDAGVKDGNGIKNSAEEPNGMGEKVSGSGSLSHMTQLKLSNCTLVTWKHWLQKLIKKSRANKPRSHCLQHFTVPAESLLRVSEAEATDSAEKERVQSLRRDLRRCMSERSLFTHSAVSASLAAPDVVPLPNPVDTDVWTDPLSQRLTLSWQGEEEWRAWWEDELGLNRGKKVEALKRKRRREKDAKRASGRRLELSGSFTSSVSYQSELGDLSDSTGWSSAASQSAWSDTEGMVSQLEGFGECETPRVATPSTAQTDNRIMTTTPQSIEDKRGDQQTPSISHTPKPVSTPSSQRRSRRPAEDYLSSLCSPQDEPLQEDSCFLEEGSTVHPSPPPRASAFSPLRSSHSVPVGTFRVDLSQSSIMSRFSQSLSQSQSSQGRLGGSQASQPKKKKSRMGF